MKDHDDFPSEEALIRAAYDRAEAARPHLNSAMSRVRGATTNHGSELAGLENSLKSIESFQGKVDRRPTWITAQEAIDKVRDLNRYTLTFPTDRCAGELR